jgi:protein-S-isoprenylcysteine O-methyltransferase Ste14
MMMIAFFWLGLPRSLGLAANKLEVSGLYRLSRNPQLLAGALVVIGNIILWPSVYAVGWAILYAVQARWMALTEEEYLLAVHDEVYAKYSQHVPRYL